MAINGNSSLNTNRPAHIKWFDRYTMLVLLILLMVGSLMLSGGWLRYQEFVSTQERLAQNTTLAVADKVTLLVQELRRSVRLFSLEKTDLIAALAADPANLDAQRRLRDKLEIHFPEYLSATISDTNGVLVNHGLGGDVGAMCRENIEKFVAGDQPRQIVIHSYEATYLFEVMGQWQHGQDSSGVFFVSFCPTLIARILEHAVLPGHELVLVKRDDPSLVEVTRGGSGGGSGDGSLDQAFRDGHLSPPKRSGVIFSRPVVGTQWDLVDIPEAGLYSDFIVNLILEETLIFLLFVFVALLMLYLVKREAHTRDEALAISREKGEFLSTMSHEIRTPLNSVIGFAELLEATNLDSRQRDYAESVRTSGQTLLALINDILDLSKMDADRLETEQVMFGLREWVDGIMRLFSEQAYAKGLELAAVVPHDIPDKVTGDPTHLQQVLVNLVGNAIKFTETGSVVVRISRLALSGGDKSDSGCLLRFSVEDTGIGVDPEQKARLFDHFTQADDSTTRHYGGTGLGLAISLRLVGLMKGLIDVEPRPQGGSEFWFSVPLKCEEDSNFRDCKTLAGQETNPRRALIIEDSPIYTELMSEHLQRLGCQFDRVAAGTEGLMMIRNGVHSDHPYDFVIMELHTPDLGGVDLARLIQADPEIRDLPIILMGFMGDEEAVQAQEEPGVVGLLHKPAGAAQMMTAIANALDVKLPRAFEHFARYSTQSKALSVEGARVLVVDDNEMNLRVANGMLKTLSCEVHTATSGAGALTMAEKLDFDLIFMDCEMPDMDGFEATARLKQMGVGREGRKTPIVAMTANAVAGDRERCLVGDFDDYLPKPVTIRLIKSMLIKWGLANQISRTLADQNATATDTVDPIQVLKPEVLEQMRGLVTAEEPGFFTELLDNFRQESAQRVQQVRAAMAKDDAEEIRQALHSLKGTAGIVGAEQLEQSCELALIDARAGQLASMGQHLAGIEEDLRQALEALPRA